MAGQAVETYPLQNQIEDIVEKMLGSSSRRTNRSTARKPFPEWIDRQIPFPGGFRFPDFTLFSSEDNVSSLEHLCRFECQYKEADNNDFLKMKLFQVLLRKQPLIDTLVSLLIRYIVGRNYKLSLQNQFARTDPGVSMSDLAKLR